MNIKQVSVVEENYYLLLMWITFIKKNCHPLDYLNNEPN